MVKGFLAAKDSRLESIPEAEGFGRIAAINSIKNAINDSDEERKRFELLAREAFKKFRACVTLPGVNAHRWDMDAINIVYKSLQEDRDAADITAIIRDLHRIVDETIAPRTNAGSGEERLVYDISAIDFDALRKEYERHHGGLNSAVQNIKDAVEKRLARMIAQNPLRTNFQTHYEELVDTYNREKDRVTIERTFEELLKVVKALDDESQRAVAEGLDEESLALFDLLKKEQLDKEDIAQIKKVAKELLARLRSDLQRYHDWRARQAARDAIRTQIHDFLYADATGLPTGSYTDAEVEFRAERIYQHVLTQYADFESRTLLH
ncbi:MAG: DUF3387 domain-containing protein [Gammaproteobacteria bacterium]|nr:DUF3387 domain-containing protein [Gammaproteobacteria bacterium]